MPKLKPATQRARREHILDAAEVCFARAGFHRTTMQDICKEALISPGALYVYFNSKEDLIAGLAERDRSDFAERFADLSAATDLMQSLSQLGNHYFDEEPAHKRTMCLEIGLGIDAQSEGRGDLSLGRPLRARRASRSCSPRCSGGPHRPRRRHSYAHQAVLGDRRRHVHAPRTRSQLRRQGARPGRHGAHRQAAQRPAETTRQKKTRTRSRRR